MDSVTVWVWVSVWVQQGVLVCRCGKSLFPPLSLYLLWLNRSLAPGLSIQGSSRNHVPTQYKVVRRSSKSFVELQIRWRSWACCNAVAAVRTVQQCSTSFYSPCYFCRRRRRRLVDYNNTRVHPASFCAGATVDLTRPPAGYGSSVGGWGTGKSSRLRTSKREMFIFDQRSNSLAKG